MRSLRLTSLLCLAALHAATCWAGPKPKPDGLAITPGLPSQPGVVWAGTQPAGLFRSEDRGESWAPVESLIYHPERRYWYPTGGGASSLHGIEVDPRNGDHLYASIASGVRSFHASP